MDWAHPNGLAFVAHRADGSVKVCLHQFCTRVLSGNITSASNGVGFMLTETDFGVGNCTHAVSRAFPAAGLFAHIDFVIPAGWPGSGRKTRGARTNGSHTIAGMFVNNGPALAGLLMMDPDVDPGTCASLHRSEYCAGIVPPRLGAGVMGGGGGNGA